MKQIRPTVKDLFLGSTYYMSVILCDAGVTVIRYQRDKGTDLGTLI